jgi:outer membrane receptor for ferrienterochelin and colicin
MAFLLSRMISAERSRCSWRGELRSGWLWTPLYPSVVFRTSAHVEPAMSRNAAIVLTALTIGWTASCATTTQQGSSNRSRNVLTAEDFQNQPERNLYDLLARLRPHWVRPQGANLVSGTAPVIVYVNGVRFGEVDVLSDMALQDVERVRFVDGTDAATRYGLNVDGGVIEVTMRRGQP